MKNRLAQIFMTLIIRSLQIAFRMYFLGLEHKSRKHR